MSALPDPKILATELLAAAEKCAPIEPFSVKYGALTAEGADAIRSAWGRLKIAFGGRLVGRKLGAVQRKWRGHAQVLEAGWGYIFDENVLTDGTVLPASHLIKPRVEGEFAFLMGRDLAGPGLTTAQALAAVEAVFPAFEVIDSRFTVKGTAEDATADNMSHAYAVVGPRLLPVSSLDLAAASVRLAVNGVEKGSGTGAKIAGHPVHGLVALANQAALRAGDIVLTGSVTGAFSVAAGDKVRAEFEGLGTLSLDLE